MSRLSPAREAEIGRALSVRFYTDEAKWALGDYIGEVAALRAELAEVQRDRDDLARQAEAAAEVNRQLDAELAEAQQRAATWESRAREGHPETQILIDQLRAELVVERERFRSATAFENDVLSNELAEANARVAELVAAGHKAVTAMYGFARTESEELRQFNAANELRDAIAKAEAAQKGT